VAALIEAIIDLMTAADFGEIRIFLARHSPVFLERFVPGGQRDFLGVL
jgi:hypothetical protein